MEPLTIEYDFRFKGGGAKSFVVRLDRATLALAPRCAPDPPAWALLEHKKCENCPLNAKAHPYCPVALNIADVAGEFRDIVSHADVTVTVKTEERTYVKDTTVQKGLGSLIGIIMTTSGCPILAHLKPMVRFHLPFASLEETMFRMVSMYLMVQYYRSKEGWPAEWTLDGLMRIYKEVSVVNRCFSNRLLDAAKKDANINALVSLDCFASMMPLMAEDMLKSLRPYFSSYFR